MTRRRTVQAALLLTAAAIALVVALRTIPFVSSQRDTARFVGVHDIAARGVRFTDRRTGETFVARGWNYVRLGRQQTAGGPIVYHTTFNVGRYEAARAGRALRAMGAAGYDVVRVFMNTVCLRDCLVDPRSGELSRAYLENVTDFLRRAAAAHVYVLLTIDHIPSSGRYGALLQAGHTPRVAGVNLVFLTDGGVRASAAFWHDLVGTLAGLGAPLQAVLGYELQNEVTFATGQPPLSLRSGTVASPSGRVYRLASATARRQLLADALVHWIDATRTAIRSVDPTTLVGIGFAQPLHPGSTQTLLVRAAIERSRVDFVDVHAYPGVGEPFPRYATEAGFAASRKPLLMGELGAFKALYPTAVAAGDALAAQILASCPYRFGGWVAWSWNTEDQPELWNARSYGGALERALAPRAWPDPCAHAATSASSSTLPSTTSESK